MRGEREGGGGRKGWQRVNRAACASGGALHAEKPEWEKRAPALRRGTPDTPRQPVTLVLHILALEETLPPANGEAMRGCVTVNYIRIQPLASSRPSDVTGGK